MTKKIIPKKDLKNASSRDEAVKTKDKKTDKNINKKLQYIFGFLALVIILIISLLLVVYYVYYSDHSVNESANDLVDSDLPKFDEIQKVEDEFVRKLDGALVENEDQANPRVAAVMIEDQYQSRPQSGLAAAPLVYSTLAEGGITRFVAFFNGDEAQAKIGPVRSARPYYIEWVSEFDALYGHVGGSPTALAAISGLGIKDLNQMTGYYMYYWRDSGRYAPHNAYTSSELLNTAIRDLEITEGYDFRSWKYKDETSKEVAGDISIYVDYSSGVTYDAEYRYDNENNDYIRYQAGYPQKDTNSGDIRVKNIAIVRVSAEDYEYEKGRLILDISGTGEAWVFRDGLKIHGTWEKENRTSRTLFYDELSKEIEFNRGNTWVEVVPGERGIIYNE